MKLQFLSYPANAMSAQEIADFFLTGLFHDAVPFQFQILPVNRQPRIDDLLIQLAANICLIRQSSSKRTALRRFLPTGVMYGAIIPCPIA